MSIKFNITNIKHVIRKSSNRIIKTKKGFKFLISYLTKNHELPYSKIMVDKNTKTVHSMQNPLEG